MRLTLDDKIIEEAGLTLNEVLFGLILKSGEDITLIRAHLIEKKYIVQNGMFNEYVLTHGFNNKIMDTVLNSDPEKLPEERILNLANKLALIFPEGKKDGTIYYWRGNKKEITQKLKTFFKKYGNEFSDEQIIEATTKYVKAFNGLYKNMRLLKYFIIKNVTNSAGENEEVSELLSYIENSKDVTDLKEEWTSTLK